MVEYVEGYPVAGVKKKVIEELKTFPQLDDIKDTMHYSYLTLFHDEECEKTITEKKMPEGEEFYAKLEVVEKIKWKQTQQTSLIRTFDDLGGTIAEVSNFIKRRKGNADADYGADAEYIEFSREILGSSHTKILHVRKPHYPKLFELITQNYLNNNASRAIIVSGTPGIGKTMFGIYFAIQLGLKYSDAVIIYRYRDKEYLLNPTRAFNFDKKNFGVADTEDPYLTRNQANDSMFVTLISSKEVWYLVDPGPLDFNTATHAPCRTVVFKSPKASIKGLDKGTLLYYYMPTWSEEELLNLASKFKKTEVGVKEAFLKFGGIPRMVLLKDMVQANAEMDNAFKCLSVEKMKDVLSPECDPAAASGKLVHMIPKDAYAGYDVAYASESVGQRVYEKLRKDIDFEKKLFLSSTINMGPFASLRGFVAEDMYHHVMADGGGFSFRSLETETEVNTVVLPRCEKISFDTKDMRNLDAFGIADYAYPTFPNFPAVDAFALIENKILSKDVQDKSYCCLGFQMTLVGENGNRKPKHGIGVKGLTDMIKKVRDLNPTLEIVPAVVFTVCEGLDTLFSKQLYTNAEGKKYDKALPKALDGVKQYVLAVPNTKISNADDVRKLLGEQ